MASVDSTAKNRRPLTVTIIGWVYIAIGAVGFTYHATELIRQPFDYDSLWIELIRILAVISGVFMLRERDWARWLALVWIGAHVILSAFNSLPQLAMHALFFAILTYFLTRSSVNSYFRAPKKQQ